MMGVVEKDIGVAADTGSAAHKAIALWHTIARGNIDAALVGMVQALQEYPKADLEDAEKLFRSYSSDRANQTARIVAIEQKVTFTISPSESDPTGKPIVIMGTFDQIRDDRDVWKLWDYKTGKPDGDDMVDDHTLQLAAYCYGATQHFKRIVEPGGIIRGRGYTSRSGKVFFGVRWSYSHVSVLLDSLRETVAMIRRGNVFPVQGKYCWYCPHGGPENCIPALVQLGD